MSNLIKCSSQRNRLPNRRANSSFTLEVDGLSYVCTVGHFSDGRVGEVFVSNQKSNRGSDTAARDAAIACSIALQYGAPLEVIRQALCRDSQGRASGVLGAALDLIAEGEQ
jgi:hypothetical protein